MVITKEMLLQIMNSKLSVDHNGNLLGVEEIADEFIKMIEVQQNTLDMFEAEHYNNQIGGGYD